jgi:hypothetical protein
MARVFILYEHRLFHDILVNALASHTVVGSVGRRTTAVAGVIEALDRSHANLVIIEGAADNGNAAWPIALAGSQRRRVILLDMERGVARDLFTRTTAIDTLEDLAHLLGDSQPRSLFA